ncbi:MATE family efflux transporter [Actinomycetaceae bacterium MB13-C1-2]|nr:MATE family efflux transporter [Actinomycetaceae bacterium MB13-C1-2]
MPKNLTSGTPWKVIVIFAVPLLIGNVVQQLYQVIDAMVVGQHLGVNSLAAVGATGAMMFLLIGFAWGMTTGFAIPTAQAFGAGDMKAVRLSVAAGTILTGLTTVLVTVVGTLFSRDLLTLMQTPPELLDDATTFATISFAGCVAVMYFNYLSAIIRARGDSRPPLVFLVTSCLINIALVILFVQYLDFGIGGAAGATVVAQLVSVALCLGYVHKAVPELHVRREEWAESRHVIGEHLRIGLPMGFQSSIIAIGTLSVQVRLNMLGAEAVASYTTAMRVDGLASAFLASLGLAVSTYVAQNFGAHKIDRIMKGVRQGVGISIATGLLLGVTLITFGEPIVRMFVGTGHSNVIAMSHEYLVLNGVAYFILGILFTTRGALQGLGRVMVPTISGFLELAMRVTAAIVLAGSMGFTGIAIASPLAWIGAICMLVPAWIRARRNLAREAELAAERRHETDLEGERDEASSPSHEEVLCAG